MPVYCPLTKHWRNMVIFKKREELYWEGRSLQTCTCMIYIKLFVVFFPSLFFDPFIWIVITHAHGALSIGPLTIHLRNIVIFTRGTVILGRVLPQMSTFIICTQFLVILFFICFYFFWPFHINNGYSCSWRIIHWSPDNT